MDKKKEKKWLFIYLPDGRIEQYSTKDVGDTDNITLAETIECEVDQVRVAYKVDGKIESKAYVRMPYILEIWQ